MVFDPELEQRLRELQAQLASVNARIALEQFAHRLLGSRVLELQWQVWRLSQPPLPEPPGVAPEDLASSVLKAFAQANARLMEEAARVALVVADLEVSMPGAFAAAADGVRFVPPQPGAPGALTLGSVHVRAGQVPTPAAPTTTGG